MGYLCQNGGGQCNNTGLKPHNYVILQEKLSTESHRLKKSKSAFESLCIFSQLWAERSEFYVIPWLWGGGGGCWNSLGLHSRRFPGNHQIPF